MEKRDYRRINTEGQINVKNELGDIHAAFLDNISFGGLGIYTKEKIEPGKVIDFELVMQLLDKPLIGKGIIKYANEPTDKHNPIFRMGVKFTDVSADTLAYIISRIQSAQARKITKGPKGADPIDFIPY